MFVAKVTGSLVSTQKADALVDGLDNLLSREGFEVSSEDGDTVWRADRVRRPIF